MKKIIVTSHELAKELLGRPDDFITASIGEKEYVIDNIQRVKTHANTDDSIVYWTINLRNGGTGNIFR